MPHLTACKSDEYITSIFAQGTNVTVERKDGSVSRLTLGKLDDPDLVINQQSWGCLEVLSPKLEAVTVYRVKVSGVFGSIEREFDSEDARQNFIRDVRLENPSFKIEESETEKQVRTK
jgi:hypothetical protein